MYSLQHVNHDQLLFAPGEATENEASEGARNLASSDRIMQMYIA